MCAQWTKKTFELVNGAGAIPAVGLGTWQSGPNEVRKAVAAALKAGYRHIDTAAAYGNEAEVGQGIVDSGVPRSEIWLTAKLNNPDHKRVAAAVEDSLKNLGTDYVDLYLMHWPCSSDPADPEVKTVYKDWNFVDTWKEMEKIPESKVRNIGISNFDIVNLEKLLPQAKRLPAVNQIELHPNMPTPKLVKYCEHKGIHCTAYSCLGSTNSPLASDETIAQIAKTHNTTIQAVVLVWGLSRGTSVIPKSVTPSRIEGNWNSLDGLELTPEEIETLSTRPDQLKVCGDDWLGPGNKVFHELE